MEFLATFLDRNPDAHAVRLVFATKLVEGGKPNDAVPQLLRLDSLNVAPAALQLGKLCMATGDFNGAVVWMQRVLQLDPGNPEATELIGKLRLAAAS